MDLVLDPNADAFSEQELAALLFSKKLCVGELTVADFDRLRRSFNEQDTAEIVAFSAWQFTGPAVLTSWGAEGYKRDGQVVLEALPVRLAYIDSAKSGQPLPPVPDPPHLSLNDLLKRAEFRQSPAPLWLEFLSSHPTLPSTWGGMYEMLIEQGVVECRIKQLQRVLIADRFDCPVWAPAQSFSILGEGIGARERDAIKASDFSVFSERERAALHYAEALILSGHVEDDVFQSLREAFTWSEIVELGFAVAAQAGAARVVGAVLMDQ